MARRGAPALCAGVTRNRASRATTPALSARNDIELTDFWVIASELTKANQHFDERLDVRRRIAAVPLQELPHPGSRHQPAREQCIQRWQFE